MQRGKFDTRAGESQIYKYRKGFYHKYIVIFQSNGERKVNIWFHSMCDGMLFEIFVFHSRCGNRMENAVFGVRFRFA